MLYCPSGDPVPRILTSTAALRCGITRAVQRTEVERGRWQCLTRGVLLTRPDPPTRGDWIQVGLAVCGPHAVVSGWDAVRYYEVGPRQPPSDDVLLLTRHGTHRRVGRVWIRPSRRAVRAEQVLLPGAGSAYVAAPGRAVADLSLAMHSLLPVRAIVTAAVQRGLCRVEELEWELEQGPRNASAFLRIAVADVRAGALSLPEAELAELMRAHGLPAFELNTRIIDDAGRHVATADVLWRSLRAVLEVDSQEHHFLEPDWRRTMRRHNELSRLGLAVTHYPPAQIRDDPHGTLDQIDRWLRSRAQELGVTYPPPPATASGPFSPWESLSPPVAIGDQQA